MLSYTEISKNEAMFSMSAFRDIGLAAYGMHHEAVGDDNHQRMMNAISNHENWLELLQHAYNFVCKEDDTLVGMAFLIPAGHPWKFFEAEWAYIRMVGVLPAYQGQGIGKTLMQQCIAKANETGEQTIALHTGEFMKPARKIYESMGFKILRTLDYMKDQDYWIYTLDLKP